MTEMRNTYKILGPKISRKEFTWDEELGIDRRIMLKLILNT
jgi:hypothetical protein